MRTPDLIDAPEDALNAADTEIVISYTENGVTQTASQPIKVLSVTPATLSGFSAAPEWTFNGSECVITSDHIDLTWSGNAPAEDRFSAVLSYAFFTDPECTNVLTQSPKPGTSYYVRFVVWNNLEWDHSLNFRQLAMQDCRLLLPGFDTECVLKRAGSDGGQDQAEGLFRICRQESSVRTLDAIRITQPSATNYLEGDIFDPAGMVVTADYSDGTSVEVSGYTWEPDAAFLCSDTEIIVSYTENGVTKTASLPITVQALEPVRINPFTDVKDDSYCYEPVLWAYCHDPQITSGTSETTFSPNDACTRAQIVTFLWRTAGSPEPATTNNPFKDVASDKYYYKAVLWAADNGITSGTAADKFSPNGGCTRAQVVTFLWRFAGSPEPTTTTNPFTDVPSGKYYTKAVLWAAQKGVTAGTSATSFSPEKTCTRGQIVTFLYRYMKG